MYVYMYSECTARDGTDFFVILWFLTMTDTPEISTHCKTCPYMYMYMYGHVHTCTCTCICIMCGWS